MRVTHILLAILLAGCATQNQNPPERRLSTYAPSVTGALTDRVVGMAPEVLQYLQKLAPAAGFASHAPSAQDKALFQQYVALLPPAFVRELDAHVARVYFVDHFDSGAMSDVVFDDKGQFEVILYLNARLLTTPLSDWIAFRDASSFSASDDVVLKSMVTGDYFGLLHGLVHEASHVYDYYHHVTPFVEEWQKPGAAASTPFVSDVWSDLAVPKPAFDVRGASQYSGYGLGGTVSRGEAPGLYQRLAASPYASLYGTLTWSEDFAESFAWWYLQSKFDVRYQVTVTVNGTEAARFAPFATASSRARIPVLEQVAGL